MTSTLRVGRHSGSGRPEHLSEDAKLAEVVALAKAPLETFAGGGTIPESVNYRLAEECGTCSYYRNPDYCTMFDADVEPEYVCDEWVAAE